MITDTGIFRTKMEELIDKGLSLNMAYQEKIIAEMHMDSSEYPEALKHVLGQFEYYKIKVNDQFYDLVAEAAAMLEWPESKYEFLKDQMLPKWRLL